MKITSTAAQIAANTENAQHSTGPRTGEGKSTAARNNFRHGLTGDFAVLDWEDEDAFSRLQTRMLCEHAPQGPTETVLVDNIVRHQWLLQRAFRLQENCFDSQTGDCHRPDRLALYIRYQTTNERAFHKCLAELKKLQNERRKLQTSQVIEEIGFESQNRSIAAAAAEKRRSELHEIRLELLKTKLAGVQTAASVPPNRHHPRPEAPPSRSRNSVVVLNASCILRTGSLFHQILESPPSNSAFMAGKQDKT